MNKHNVKRVLIATGLLGLVGAVGAQTYYTHKVAERLEAHNAMQQAETAPPALQAFNDPWAMMQADMQRMQAQMDRFFGATIGDLRTVGLPGPDTVNQVTVNEVDDSYVVKADIPGAKESDINVNLEGRLLSISSQRSGEDKQTADNGQVVHQERYTTQFQQAFTLPGPVDATGMQSHYQDGVLTVTVPKATS